MPSGKVAYAQTDQEILDCFPVLKELRPNLAKEELVARVRRQQAEGFHLVYVRDQGQVKSVAGFRFREHLAWGRIMYVDDLATLSSEQRKGYGGYLLDWLTALARKEGCSAAHLDSGQNRYDAHRLYLNKGFILRSHHFSLDLKKQ